MTKPKAQFEIITPLDAHKFLNNNHSNRPLDIRRVARYAREMRLGRWMVNGDTIKICSDGTLLDGQHRLEAITRSDTTIEYLVVRDLPKEIFATLDAGKNRSGGDVLSIQGHLYTTHLASAARTVFSLETSTKGKVITNTDILGVIEAAPSLPKNVITFCRSYRKVGKMLGFGTGAALYHIFLQKQPELAKEYFQGLEIGANLDANSVTYQVREKLIILIGTGWASVKVSYKIAIIIRGWNLMREGLYDTRLVVSDNITIDEIK